MPDPTPARLLLMGATGRVGRMVLAHWRALPPLGLSVVAQDRLGGIPGSVIWSPLDGPAPLMAAIEREGGFKALVVLAGIVSGSKAELALNSELAIAGMRAARAAGINRVLLASSSAVYGFGENLAEDASLAPLNPYGEAKLAMERQCNPFREAGLEVCALRIGNVAGADALLVNVARAAPGQSLAIHQFPDGSGPVRSYVGAGTLASILARLATFADPLPQVLNIAAPVPIAMADLAKAAAAQWDWEPAPANTQGRITLDCTALARLYPFAQSDSDPAEMVAQWRACKK